MSFIYSFFLRFFWGIYFLLSFSLTHLLEYMIILSHCLIVYVSYVFACVCFCSWHFEYLLKVCHCHRYLSECFCSLLFCFCLQRKIKTHRQAMRQYCCFCCFYCLPLTLSTACWRLWKIKYQQQQQQQRIE